MKPSDSALAVAARYSEAIRDRDIAAIRELLHPTVRSVSATNEMHFGIDGVLAWLTTELADPRVVFTPLATYGDDDIVVIVATWADADEHPDQLIEYTIALTVRDESLIFIVVDD